MSSLLKIMQKTAFIKSKYAIMEVKTHVLLQSSVSLCFSKINGLCLIG